MKFGTITAPLGQRSPALPASSTLPLSIRSVAGSGFTLIEVMLVIALMGILSAIIVVHFTGLSRQRRLTDTVEEIVFFDRLSRADALRSNRPEMLLFDLDRQRIDRVDAQTQEPRGNGLTLVQDGADGTHMDELCFGSTTVSHGQVALPCSSQGLTPSYTLALSGIANQKRWIFVAGITGQSRIMTQPEQFTDSIEGGGSAKP